MFRTVVPLAPIAVEKVGPHDVTQVKTQARTQVRLTDQILAFCAEPHSKAEIAEHCGYKNTKGFTKRYLRPLLDKGQLQMTIPDKPRSQHPKYVTVQKAEYLKRRQMRQTRRSQHLKAVQACCILLERRCPLSSCCFHARQDIEQFLGQCLHTAGW